MTQSNTDTDEKRHNASDRRAPEGRRATDRGEVSVDAIKDVSVPEHRRRKAVRRSGDDRRHPE